MKRGASKGSPRAKRKHPEPEPAPAGKREPPAPPQPAHRGEHPRGTDKRGIDYPDGGAR